LIFTKGIEIVNFKRRDFLKTVTIGAGALMTTHLNGFGSLMASSGEIDSAKSTAYFGFTEEDLRKLLDTGTNIGADFVELFFEHRVANMVTMEEDIIKSSSEDISLGVGARVIKDKTTGYAYTSDLTMESIGKAVVTAAAIAAGAAKPGIAAFNKGTIIKTVYDDVNPLYHRGIPEKTGLIRRAYDAAKNYDSRIKKVTASLFDEKQLITIANSEGLLITDLRPQVRLTVSATAESGSVRNTGSGSDGGRVGAGYFTTTRTPESIGKEAAEEAVILLGADNPPAGEQTVVLSKDKSGVMIHEAVGHPLEADGAWKKTSIMWDRMGQQVASDIVNIYDDATIPSYRGSLNIDDEGTPTAPVPLIENGRLTGFLNDKLSAKLLGQAPNGHARRQSFMYPPIPRMNNTMLKKGNSTPEEIIASVKKGFYAVTYQGGMVNNTGKFTFSVNLGYLIEDGKLTKPVKNATLIGTNIQILKDIDMIGNDTGIFLGSCGKDGQTVPVTCGTPTLRIRKMTVGGTA